LGYELLRNVEFKLGELHGEAELWASARRYKIPRAMSSPNTEP
jgi:hypothetical protein